MAKKKTEPIFQTWEQVDDALKGISKIDQAVKIHEAKMNDDINMIKTKVQSITTPLLEEKALLENNIKEFTKANAAEFKDKKTKDFTFGQVGFRKSTSIVTRNVKAIIEALKNNKMLDCIITKESINKDELTKYDDTSLEKVGAKRKVDDVFFYKVDEERIDK